MGKPGSEMTRVERLEARNRHWAYAEQVLDMFTRGESYRSISRATEIPLASLHLMVKQLTGEYVEERYGDRNAAIGRELALLDALTRKNLKPAMDGNVNAAKIVLEASRDRRRLLGLDAAVRSEVKLTTPLDSEIEQLMNLIANTQAADAPVPAE